MIDPELLAILACPACRAALRLARGEALPRASALRLARGEALPRASALRPADGRLRCTNPGCGLAYPVVGGVPILLVEAAQPA